MKIDLKVQIEVDPLYPAGPLAGYSGSTVLAELVGVPASLAGGTVAGVEVTLTTPDGLQVTEPAEKVGSEWHVLFAASNFTCFGTTRRGFKAVAIIVRDDGTTFPYTLGIGNLHIDAGTPDAQPGDPSKSYVVKGEDIYVKTRVIDDVQHYARQEMSYDAEMGAWGAEWLGDYILVDGEFVPFQAAGGTAATVATALLALLLVPFSAFGITATKEYVDRKDGENAVAATNLVTSATNALAKAVAKNSADIATLSDTTATINSKIPSAASASNQLADKEWIDDEIDTYAAYYITYTAAGAAFPTRAALLNATVVYSGGAARTPTRNDYAVVLADESHGGAEWRYIYTVAEGVTSGQWDAQYPIETNDYDALANKPQINGVSLSGNKTGADLGVLDLAGGTMTGPINMGDNYLKWRDGNLIYRLSAYGLYIWDDGDDVTHSPVYRIAFPMASGTLALTSDIDAAISPTSPAFANAVLSVGLGIDTNTVAVINELVDSAQDLPVTGATSVGALLLALAAAVAALKKKFGYDTPAAITASAQLADRTNNRVEPTQGSAAIALTFPDAVAGKGRDFLVLVSPGANYSGTISFTTPANATIYGDGFGATIAAGESWLFSVTEIAFNVFYTRAQKMEVPT